jgi:hypothetical protein
MECVEMESARRLRFFVLTEKPIRNVQPIFGAAP